METKAPMYAANPTGKQASPFNQSLAASNEHLKLYSASQLASNSTEKPGITRSRQQLDGGTLTSCLSDAAVSAAATSTFTLAAVANATPTAAVTAAAALPSDRFLLTAQLPRQTIVPAAVATAVATATNTAHQIRVSQPVSPLTHVVSLVPSQDSRLQPRQLPAAQLLDVAHETSVAPDAIGRALPPPASAVLAAATAATQSAQDTTAGSLSLPGVQHMYHDPEMASAPRVVTGAGIPVPVIPVAAIPPPGASSANAVPELTPKRQGALLIKQAAEVAARAEMAAGDMMNRLRLNDEDTSEQSRRGSARAMRPSANAEGPVSRAALKGLRHFSMKVCQKVESKGRTTYNEVADELVRDFSSPQTTSATGVQFDEKNIRRRVYDALNVLMAINVIRKEKKNIQWCGLAAGLAGPACDAARVERAKLRTSLTRSHAFLEELLSQQAALQRLIARNADMPASSLLTHVDAGGPTPLQLPFIIIQAGQEARVELQLSDDSTEVHFDFHGTPFRIHGDDTLLKLMDLEVKPQLPRTSASGDLANGQPGSRPCSRPQLQSSSARGPEFKRRQLEGDLLLDAREVRGRRGCLAHLQASPRLIHARLGSSDGSAADVAAAAAAAAGDGCDGRSNKRRRLQSVTPLGPPLTIDASAGTSPWPNELLRSLNVASWSPSILLSPHTIKAQGGPVGLATEWPTAVSPQLARPPPSGVSMAALLQAPPSTPPAPAKQAAMQRDTGEASPANLDQTSM